MEAQQSKPKGDAFTWILAILGTALVVFTVLMPFILSVIFAFQEQVFLFDFLMPAEMFPFAIVGGVLLFWAALRKRSRREWIGWSLGSGFLMLVVSQLIAVLTGLANGTAQPGTPWRTVVFLALLGYVLAVIFLAVGGILLLLRIFQSRDASSEKADVEG